MALLPPLAIDAASPSDPTFDLAASDFRMAMSGLLTSRALLHARSGFLGGPPTVTAQPTPNNTVTVGSFIAVVDHDSFGEGAIIQPNVGSLTLDCGAPDATNARIDVIVYTWVAEDDGGTRGGAVQVVQGTPSANPVAPVPPANSLVIGLVRRRRAPSPINSSDVTVTAQITVAQGGVLPTTFSPGAPAYDGQVISRLDSGGQLFVAINGGYKPVPTGATSQAALGAAAGGWADVTGYQPATYYRDASGWVHFVGVASNLGIYHGGSPITPFNAFPAGFRPPNIVGGCKGQLGGAGASLAGGNGGFDWEIRTDGLIYITRTSVLNGSGVPSGTADVPVGTIHLLAGSWPTT